MPKEERKPYRSNRTGEDIDMLREKQKEDRDNSSSNGYAYRDSYDAA